ncbi:hypothetical protein [Desulfitobacterium sp.]|uniref:hypothetical protein n=1 Tax=Desulfitobacterium sp. TaxID=49981 RepID=UPI002B89D562|nr:hypothetical protein [Desulfitobacterium sp.]HVJ48026.1 hypothetical protein [Desulfitobacterium sp.]
MLDLTTVLSYGYFLLCLVLGWTAAGVLNYEGLLKRSTSGSRGLLLKIGVALVLAEGFRIFLSFLLGPLLDGLVSQSINSLGIY